MQAGNDSERQTVAAALRDKNGDAFADIMAIVQRTGGVEATRDAALHHQYLAIASLDALNASEPVDALRMMANKAVDRQS